MTVTEEAAPKVAKPAPKAEPGRWWTPKGDTGRRTLREAEIRQDAALAEAPPEVAKRHAPYEDYLVLIVPESEGYIYNITADAKSGHFVLTVEKRYWKEAKEPGASPPPELPKELQGLEGEAFVRAVAEYHARTERALASLRRHAIKKGMCDTFDKIMEHAGFEGRPKRYRLTLAHEAERVFTDQDGKNYIAGFISWATPEVKAKTRVSVKYDVDLGKQPAENTLVKDLNLPTWELDKIKDTFANNGHTVLKDQIGKIVVTSASVMSNY